ncbi:MAG TPA: thioesterase II family protein [Pyrinomonadaceae bacterium]|nr:thioesterase II family protein [Pyrinomonadaceae bacterium]
MVANVQTEGSAKFTCKRPVQDAPLRLFCFPYAGGGVSSFRTWPEYLPHNVELQALEMPGREGQLRQPSFVSVEPLVRAIAGAMKSYMDRPFAFFGHSMGALMSFELARLLRREQGITPRALFVSGRRAPHLPLEPATYNLPDDEFVQELRDIGGTPEEVLAHPELLKLLMPTLRADFELCQTYQYNDDAPLNCQITAFGGLNDQFVPRDELDKWREQTTGPFHLRMFPGDHFFLHSSQTLLLQMLSRDLVNVISSLPKP